MLSIDLVMQHRQDLRSDIIKELKLNESYFTTEHHAIVITKIDSEHIKTPLVLVALYIGTYTCYAWSALEPDLPSPTAL